MDLGSLFNGGLSFLQGQGTFNNLARGAIGAGLAHYFAPKMQTVAPVSRAQLDAATLPAMRRSANRRMAYLQGAQGAKGGMSSSDLFERNNLRTQLGQKEAQQMAFNDISAQRQQVEAAQRDYAARMGRFNNLLAGGIAGYNLLDGNKKNKQNNNQQQQPQQQAMQHPVVQPVFAPPAYQYYGLNNQPETSGILT